MGEHRTIQSLVDAAQKTGLSHVVLTGGEPMLPPESVALAKAMRQVGLHVTIETAGTVDRNIECDLMSISPKFRSSTPDPVEHPKWSVLHEQRRMPIATMLSLIDRSPEFQIKFVVDSTNDYTETLQVVDQLKIQPTDVWIMPQGSTIEAMDKASVWLKPWAESNGFHYCDRMQIRWFGNRRGT